MNGGVLLQFQVSTNGGGVFLYFQTPANLQDNRDNSREDSYKGEETPIVWYRINYFIQIV